MKNYRQLHFPKAAHELTLTHIRAFLPAATHMHALASHSRRFVKLIEQLPQSAHSERLQAALSSFMRYHGKRLHMELLARGETPHYPVLPDDPAHPEPIWIDEQNRPVNPNDVISNEEADRDA